MKTFVKIISALIVLVVCLTAVGCGGDSSGKGGENGDGKDETMENENPVTDNRTKVGDKIVLGKYEQDGNADSTEDISWTVIKVEEGRALLLADYCLANLGFHDAYEEFSWADSFLRDWLNVDFYNKAFDDGEKALVLRTSVDNDKNYIFAIGDDNITTDSVFLLSLDEAKELLDEGSIIGVPTEKVKNTANLTHGKKSCNWWLRTPGANDMKSVVVGYNGVINVSGLRGDIAEAGVRPCIWYATETNAEAVKLPYTFDKLGEAQVGDKVLVGRYDNDSNEENGAEDIVWTVAAVENGKKLLVADSAVEAKTYHAQLNEGVSWKDASLRSWLNTGFMNKAFNADERAKISTTTVTTKDINGGEDIVVYNQMFVLSAEELVKYFPERTDRMIKPTATAIANGVYVDPMYGTCDYWLRDAGTTAGNGAYVYYYGDVNEAGALARSTFIGVRPAMWIVCE